MTMPPTPTLLIVDDDKDILALLREFLSDKGYEILVAERGSTALEIIRNQDLDLVLLDIRLPDMDGLQILQTVVKTAPELPIIMLSGKATKEDVVEALKLGAWDFLDKPFDRWEILTHSIGKVLERARLLKEKEEYRHSLEKIVEKKSLDLRDRSSELQQAYQRLEKEKNKRLEAEMAIDNEKRFMQTLIDGVREPARIITTDHQVVIMNQAAAALMPSRLVYEEGLTCHQAYRQSDLVCGGADHPCILKMVQEDGKAAICTHTDKAENGKDKVLQLEALPLWNEDSSLYGILEVFRPLTSDQDVEEQLREHQARLYFLAHHDTLTNLPNRMLFQDRLQRMMVKAKRNQYNIAVLFLDLDRFQKINETLGHEIGDQLLCEVGNRLERCLRKSDTVARLGGDEFAIILDEIKDLKFVAVVARKILNSLAEAIHIKEYELYTTTSIGISTYPEDSDSVEGLMQCADSAVFRAKESGKNKYQYFTADMNAKAFEFLLMESGLRKAIENDELVVYYQPQFSMATNSLVGMEALLRWNHPDKGIVPPDSFIPLAEETGLIDSIGHWILEKACAQNKAWQDAGHQPIAVAINISARQFRQVHLVETISRVLKETGLAPHYLELELTESIVMHDAEKTLATLKELRDMGIKLAVDDFGTGYSSLSYLKMFPINFLKIDKSFVFNITTDMADQAIATSIIALAHSMGLKVIAEGVETAEQLELLSKEGCDYVQGYHFSGPIMAKEFERFFK